MKKHRERVCRHTELFNNSAVNCSLKHLKVEVDCYQILICNTITILSTSNYRDNFMDIYFYM